MYVTLKCKQQHQSFKKEQVYNVLELTDPCYQLYTYSMYVWYPNEVWMAYKAVIYTTHKNSQPK